MRGRTPADQFAVRYLAEVHRTSGVCGPPGWPSLHRPLGRQNRGRTHRAFQETVDDPVLKFEGMNEETTVNITAYIFK